MSHRSGGPADAPSQGFERLLTLLDADPAGQGARFDTIRRRLIRLFLWRGANDPETLADETFERAAGKLADGVVVEASDPFRYLAGIARLVALEALNRERRARAVLEDARHQPEPDQAVPEDEERHRCLERCLGELGPGPRDQILDFYRGEKGTRIARRRAMADALGITVNALRIRAHRLRAKLESCVRACMAEKADAKHLAVHRHQEVSGRPPQDESRP